MTLKNTPLDQFKNRLMKDLKYLYESQGYSSAALGLCLVEVLKEVLETTVWFDEDQGGPEPAKEAQGDLKEEDEE